VVASDEAAADRLAEFRRLVADHAAFGSELAGRVLASPTLEDDVWLVEPLPSSAPAEPSSEAVVAPAGQPASRVLRAAS
jgi:hypothetical protein